MYAVGDAAVRSLLARIRQGRRDDLARPVDDHSGSRRLGSTGQVPIAVRGVIVVVNADSVTIKEKPADVRVLYRLQLSRWLARA